MTETKIYETARAAACWVRQQVDDGQRFSLRAADDLLGCSALVADLHGQICGQAVRYTTDERIQSVVDEHRRRRSAMNPLRRMLTPQMPPPGQIERARHQRQVSILLGSHLGTGSQRVVHAHMLGHVLERMVAGQRTGYSFSPDSPGQCPPLPPFNRSQPGANKHEAFADEFALALLMPRTCWADRARTRGTPRSRPSG